MFPIAHSVDELNSDLCFWTNPLPHPNAMEDALDFPGVWQITFVYYELFWSKNEVF